MIDGLRLAFGTLTALPVSPPRKVQSTVAGWAMVLAPLAALPLAVLGGLVVWAGELARLPGFPVAAVALGAVALGCRGLHLDGLADTADGLAASYDRSRALEIMRRGDSGPAGVCTLVLVLLVQCGALAGAPGVAPVVLAVLAGRCVLALCCARGVPSARPDGLGAAVAGSVPVPLVLLGFLLFAGLGALAPGMPWWRGALAVLAAYVAAGVVLWRCVRRFGGITGDVLGACVEVATAAALLVLA